MTLQVYSTLPREKRPFEPVVPGRVSMYVCGPTVYKPSHVGHMVGPVIFDAIKRFLTYLGYQVTFVVNITDVDDKLIIEAGKQGITVKELAERVTADYVTNLKRLHVTSIDHMPKVSEHMPQILDMIGGLIEKGFAYPAGGDVYFDITKDDDYGKLCRRDPEQMEAGARIEPSAHKRNPGDFALWKASKPGEPTWESPWGPGRPGWHIECSAMSRALLGDTLDIHGGGLDLQFPHHENELAQSESFTGKPFARYWLHNGLMRIRSQAQKIKDAPPTAGDAGGELVKMSKSLGNEIVVSELFKKHRPETLRLLLLSSHYRSPIEYSEDRLAELRRALENFYRFFGRYERITGTSFYAIAAKTRMGEWSDAGPLGKDAGPHRAAFLAAMHDDFNTGGAIAALYELLNTLNRFADTQKLEAGGAAPEAVTEFRRGAELLRELGQVLGLFLEPAKAAETGDELVGGLMQLLLDLRAQARKEKNFAMADQIRKRLTELGVTLEDRPGGTGWRRG